MYLNHHSPFVFAFPVFFLILLFMLIVFFLAHDHAQPYSDGNASNSCHMDGHHHEKHNLFSQVIIASFVRPTYMQIHTNLCFFTDLASFPTQGALENHNSAGTGAASKTGTTA